MEKAIVLKQKPVISHQLALVGEEVTKRIEELNIDNLVATTETLKSLKKLRATLNSELKSFETQRKAIKKGVSEPYLKFENVYKEEISNKYNDAIKKLKEKIESVEIKLIEDKTKTLKAYYNELCEAENIDFIPFEKTGIKVNLSSTMTSLKEEASNFINRVKDDLSLIDTMEYKAEILVRYKQTLNVSESIREINEQKEQALKEEEKIKQLKIQQRKKEIEKLGMVEFAGIYTYKGEAISIEDVEKLSDEDFQKRFNQVKENIERIKKSNSENQTETPEIKESLEAPTVEQQEIKTAAFKVYGTIEQLKKLGEYMRENKIKYYNI